MSRMVGRPLVGLIASMALAACATTPDAGPAAAAETISWSVGPCFGFCPVYTVAITPAGMVTFDGERNTTTLGRQVRQLTPQAYRAAAASLARFRPATGTSGQTVCDQRISDLSSTKIVWRRPGGAVTTLAHDKGCRSPRNDQLNAALQELPATLGIEEWTRQLTRPGVPRG